MVKKLLYISLIFVFLISINAYSEDAKEIFRKSLSPNVNFETVLNAKIQDETFTSKFIKIDDYEGYKIYINDIEVFVVKKGDTIGVEPKLKRGSLSFLGLNLPKKSELIFKNYNISIRGEEKVIGRDTYHIILTPICEGNVKKEIWVDKDTYITLKSVIYDWTGKPLKEKEVTSLTIYDKYPPILNKMKEILKTNAKKLSKWFTSYDEAERALKIKLLKPTYIPCGYKLIGVHASNRFKNTIHIVYTNGIGYISLYEKRVPIWARREKGPHKGPHPNWEKRGTRLLLIGDIKEDVLYKMAESIK